MLLAVRLGAALDAIAAREYHGGSGARRLLALERLAVREDGYGLVNNQVLVDKAAVRRVLSLGVLARERGGI